MQAYSLVLMKIKFEGLIEHDLFVKYVIKENFVLLTDPRKCFVYILYNVLHIHTHTHSHTHIRTHTTTWPFH